MYLYKTEQRTLDFRTASALSLYLSKSSLTFSNRDFASETRGSSMWSVKQKMSEERKPNTKNIDSLARKRSDKIVNIIYRIICRLFVSSIFKFLQPLKFLIRMGAPLLTLFNSRFSSCILFDFSWMSCLSRSYSATFSVRTWMVPLNSRKYNKNWETNL